MRVLSLRSLYPTKLANLVRTSSNLALAPINFSSSDSSSDEQPTRSSRYKDNFDECLLHPDTLKVADVTLRGQPEQAPGKTEFQHNIQTYVQEVRTLCCGQHIDKKRLNDITLTLVKDTLGFGISALFQAIVENIDGEEGKLGLLELVSAAFVRACNFLMNQLIGHHKVDKAVALYSQLKSLGVSPDVCTYNLLIKAYCKRGSFEVVDKVIVEMEGVGIKPNEFTYSILIEGCCLNGRSDYGYKILKHLKEQNVAFLNSSYAAVIVGFCNEMNFSEAEDVLGYIDSQRLIPHVDCFKALVRAYCRSEKFDEALKLHEKMLSKGVQTNCVILGFVIQCLCSVGRSSEVVGYFKNFKESGVFFDVKFFNVVMDALCKWGKVEDAKMLFDEIVAPDHIHYSTLINGYCLEGNIVEALNVFNAMRSKGIEPDAILYDILLGALYRNGYVKKASNLRGFMQAQGLRVNSTTQKLIIKALFTGENVKEAETFFNGLEEKSTEVYSAMVSGYCDTHHTMKAFELSSSLSQKGMLVDNEAQFKLQNKLLEGGHTQKAFRLYESCLALENHPCLKMCSKLIAAFCKDGETTNARRVFDCWVERGLNLDVVMYTIMIDGYCKAYLVPKAYELFNHMKVRGIGPDVVTYTALIDGCVKSCLESPEFCTRTMQEKKLAMDDVSTLYTEMLEENIEPDVVCFTALVDKLCRFNDLDGAFSIFDKMTCRGVKPDLVAFTALYFGCCRSGDVRGLKKLIDRIKDTGLVDEMIENDRGGVQIFFDTLQRGILHLCRHHPRLLSSEDMEKYMAIVKDFCKIVSGTGL